MLIGHLEAWELCEDVSLRGVHAQTEGPVAQQEPEQRFFYSEFEGMVTHDRALNKGIAVCHYQQAVMSNM